MHLGLALLPWLSLLPGHGALGFALGVVALIFSLHGWGLLVKRLAGVEEAPAALVVHWGLAAVLALAGLAMVVHGFGHVTQVALVIVGLSLHSALVLVDHRLARRPRALPPDARYWLIPTIGLSLVAALHLLGAAGDVVSSPFDDDGNLGAQLARLAQTGTLGDPIGLARGSQLGGQVAISAIATALAGPNWFRVVNGLGFALALWLALAQLRPRTATQSLWAMLLVFVAASYPAVAMDATPRWMVTSLLLALFVTFERYATPEDDRVLWPLGLVAAAVGVVRSELIPVAAAIIAAAGILAIGRSGSRRRTYALLAVPLAALLPYLVVRITARSSVPSAAIAALGRDHGVLVPLLVFAGLLVIAIWGALVTSGGPRRWIAIAALAGIAGIVAQLTGPRAYAIQLVWPILVSAGLAIGLQLLRDAQNLRKTALVLSLLATALIFDGRDVPGRARWARRYAELANGIEFLRHAYPTPGATDPYGALLARASANARIAVWVARPELLDYASRRIYDLRTPRGALRRAAVLRALDPDYLLVEDDHLPAERARRDLWFRLACPEGASAPYCLDDLQSLVSRGAVVATEGTVSLVRLRP